MAPFVSVVIPARNEEPTIAACLQALRRQTIGAAQLEVIVVAAGDDRTAATAMNAGDGQFRRFEVATLGEGDKNTALRAGCARATGDIVVLLDADTELAPNAVAEFVRLLASEPRGVAHGAMIPRIDSWVARYSELNRMLVKQLHFDGHLSGEVIALPRAALCGVDLTELLPDGIGANGDAYLGRVLRQRGWRTLYAQNARATTLFPWTVKGLLASQLRNRRSAMMTLSLPDAALQATKSFALLMSLPVAAVVARHSALLAIACAMPVVLHVGGVAWRIELLRRNGLGDHRRALATYAMLDLMARGLKFWAFVERLVGRRPPSVFHGERPVQPLSAKTNAALAVDHIEA
jgi:cellulose synthase/poly-beta-1,6-N-acetylglucosamine synthase-like glycosyltransferase